MEFPNCTTVYDEKIMYTMDYLVNIIGLKAKDIVARTVVLDLSIEIESNQGASWFLYLYLKDLWRKKMWTISLCWR